MVFKAGEGAGASGSFFFYSYDNRFLIKTMTNIEKNTLLSRLDKFVCHFQNNNKSLIAKIYGVYTIKSNIFDDLNVMIMQNTAILTNNKNKRMFFDMKGSTVSRKTSFPTKYRQFWQRSLHYKKTMKDLNFIEINRDHGNALIDLTDSQVNQLNTIISNDSAFLTSEGLMDYSLLLVIEGNNKIQSKESSRKSLNYSKVIPHAPLEF